jgi:hypothetical protein
VNKLKIKKQIRQFLIIYSTLEVQGPLRNARFICMTFPDQEIQKKKESSNFLLKKKIRT